jgi:hypothetical protein
MHRVIFLLIVLSACASPPAQEQTLPTLAVLPSTTPVPTVIPATSTTASTVVPTQPPTEALSCPKLVSDAMALVAGNCSDLNRDQICYGNVLLDVLPRDDAPAFTFEQSGDITNVVNIASLRLSSMSLENQAWGVAMMKILADVPETLPGQGVTFLLFGDVQIDPADEAGYGPMQAFYFKTGFNDRPCAEAPDSGLLVQTPQGTTEISLLVNEVQIELASTVYLQAQPNGDMRVNTVEGAVTVSAFGVTQPAPAGTFVTVPLDANGAASAPPQPPQPYNASDLAALPVQVLPDEIAIAPALSAAQLQAALATATIIEGSSDGGLAPGMYIFSFGLDTDCDVEMAFVDSSGALYINGSTQPFTLEGPGVYHRVTAAGVDVGRYTVSDREVSYEIDSEALTRSCAGELLSTPWGLIFPPGNDCGIQSQTFTVEDGIAAVDGLPLEADFPGVYVRTNADGMIERYDLTSPTIVYSIRDADTGEERCRVEGELGLGS